MGDAVPEKAQRLIEWMDTMSFWWNKELMRFGDGSELDDSGGTGLWARDHVSADEQLCRIPKRALLSIRNTSIADVLEEAEVAGGLGLILSVMFERAQPSSRWRGYLDFLPTREFLPTFWPKVLLQLLHGTSLPTEKVLSDLEAMREDFEQVQEIMDTHADRFEAVRDAMTFDSYLTAASWVSSRAFHVDSYHGMSLVPLADVFNHKASIVTIPGDYIVAELDDAQNLLEASIKSARKASKTAPEDETVGACRSELKRTRQTAEGGAEKAQDDGNENDAPPQQAVCSLNSKKQPRTTKGLEHKSTAPEAPAPSCCGGGNSNSNSNLKCCSGAQSKAGTGGDNNGETTAPVPGQPQSGKLPSVCTAMTSVQSADSPGMEVVPADLRLEIVIIDVDDDEEKLPEDSKEASLRDSTAEGKIQNPEDEGSLMIVAASDISKGNEIHNTYGEYSNLELLYKHGFALQKNPFNAVVVSVSDIGAAAETVMGGDAAHACMAWLQTAIVDSDSSDDESDGEEEGGGGNGEGCGRVGAPQNGGNSCCKAKCCSGKRGELPGGASARQADAQKAAADSENGATDVAKKGHSVGGSDEPSGGVEGGDGRERDGAHSEDLEMEERIDGSNLQIYEGGEVTAALLGVLWCLAEHTDLSAANASEPNAALHAFSEWLQGTLAAQVATGGATDVAAEAQRILNSMKGAEGGDESESGDEESSVENVLDQRIPLTMVLNALNQTAQKVLREVMRVRLEALQRCVEKVGVVAEAVRELSKSKSGGKQDATVSNTRVVEVITSAMQAVGPMNCEQGGKAERGDGGSDLKECFGSEDCTVAEAAQAVCGVERIAQWELSVVENIQKQMAENR